MRFSPGAGDVQVHVGQARQAAVVDRAAVGGLEGRGGPAVGLGEAGQGRDVRARCWRRRLSRTTVPVLIVFSAERVTVPPARASNCWRLVVVGSLGHGRQVGQRQGAARAGGLERGRAAIAGVAGDPGQAQRRPAADRDVAAVERRQPGEAGRSPADRDRSAGVRRELRRGDGGGAVDGQVDAGQAGQAAVARPCRRWWPGGWRWSSRWPR